MACSEGAREASVAPDGELQRKQWGAYLLRCADGSLYAGASNDMALRLRRHLAGKASRYTRSRLPVELVYWEACADRSAALKREVALKRLPRSAKLALLRQGSAEPSMRANVSAPTGNPGVLRDAASANFT